jgi:hypothetical protein
MSRCRGPGAIGTQFGRSRSWAANASASAIELGLTKTLGWVTTRANPLGTSSERPYASSPLTTASSQARQAA